MIYAVSACLLGENCKYNGGSNYNEKVAELCGGNSCIAICPETFGGLDIPRSPAEISGGTGKDVLEGKASVINRDGKDVTHKFLLGAYSSLEAVIEAAEEGEEIVAVMKARSPSCGSGEIYNGNFDRTLVAGDGVTTALFKSKGIKVLTELEI